VRVRSVPSLTGPTCHLRARSMHSATLLPV
jgi:hypothetical protein